jgi:ribosomal protein S12 methylthiotransferase
MDVPLQHASPDVLKRMKRGAGAEIFLRSIEKMRREIPDLTLRTSFIVGFPGETEQEFESSANSCARHSSIGWAFSDIRMKRAPSV